MPRVSKTKVKKGQKQKQKQKQQVKVSQKVNIVVNRVMRPSSSIRKPPKQDTINFGSGQYFIERGTSVINPIPFKNSVETKEQLEKKAGSISTTVEALKNISNVATAKTEPPKMVEAQTSTKKPRGRPKRGEQTFITPSRQAQKEAMLPIWNETAPSTPTTDVERTVMPSSNNIRRNLKRGQKIGTIEFNTSPQEGESDWSESEVNKLFPSQKNK